VSAIVRMATTDDLAALEPILPAFLRPPNKHARFLRALVNGDVSVAEDARTVADFMWLTEFFGHTFVNVLAIEAEHRRHGYAGMLLEFAERDALTDRVFTSTNRSNVPMHTLLAHYGWTRCGEVDHIDPGDPEIVYVEYPR